MKFNILLVIAFIMLVSCARHSFTRVNEPNKIIKTIDDPYFSIITNNMLVPIGTHDSTISVITFNPFCYTPLYFTKISSSFFSHENVDVYSYYDNNISDYMYELKINDNGKVIAIQKMSTTGELLAIWEIDPVDTDFFTVFDKDTVVLAIDGIIYKYHFANKYIEEIFRSSEYICSLYFNKQKNSIYLVTIAEKLISDNGFTKVFDLQSSTRVIEYDLQSKSIISDIAGINEFYYSNRFNQEIILTKNNKSKFDLHIQDGFNEIVKYNVIKAQYIPIGNDCYFVNERYLITFALFPCFRTELALYSIETNKRLQLCDLISY